MKKFKQLLAVVLCLSAEVLALTSCIKDQPTSLTAVSDVIVQDIKTDTGVKYGIVVYATADFDIKSATVTAPGTGGKVYQLKAMGNQQQFVYYPQAADYTSEFPVTGTYSIEVISSKDQKLTGTDAVGSEKLSPIVIKTATMASQKLKTTWDKVTGAEAYIVRLYTANKAELLFSSNYLDSGLTEFEFGASSVGWTYGIAPVLNTNYVVDLLGIKAETTATTDKANNIQFITVDSKTIKWE